MSSSFSFVPYPRMPVPFEPSLINVKISPRYGSFDPSTRQIVAAQTSWIRPTKAQIAAAAAAQQQQSQ